MELMELFTILKHGENHRTEFKKDWTKQASDITKEFCALANSGGGIFLLGVDDDGTPVGISDPAKAEERLAGLARSTSPSQIVFSLKLEASKKY